MEKAISDFLEIMHGFGTTLFFCLEIIGAFLVLHVLTTLVVLLTAKIEKDAEGNLILDPDSWHFKIVYPIKRYDEDFIKNLKLYGLNICPYFLKLTFMIWSGYLFLVIFESFRAIITNLIIFNWGYYYTPGFEYLADEHWPTDVGVEKIGWLPKIRGFVIRPLYVWPPLAYLVLLLVKHEKTMAITHIVLHGASIVLACVAVVLILFAISRAIYKKITKSDDKKVSLAQEFMSSKYHKFCKKMKLKTS